MHHIIKCPECGAVDSLRYQETHEHLFLPKIDPPGECSDRYHFHLVLQDQDSCETQLTVCSACNAAWDGEPDPERFILEVS
jgi:hypothetical protein